MHPMRIFKYTTVGLFIGLPLLFQNCARGGGFETLDFSSARFGSQLQSVGITCDDPSVIPPRDIRRMNRAEIDNTVKAVFGPTIYGGLSSTIASMISDELKVDPKTFQVAYDSWQLATLDRLARQAGTLVTANDSNLSSVAGSCALAATIPDDCVQNFISQFGKKMFRRPLSATDITFFKTTYTNMGSGRAGIGGVVTALVLSPEFLYHVEQGKPGVGANNQYTLTDHEIASRISYLLTDAPPDAELTAKADDGTLRLTSTLSAQVDRLLLSDAGKAKMHRFVSYWLMLDKFQGIPTLGFFVDGLDTNGLVAEMSRELTEFVDYIVYTKRGSYKDLLTSKASFARGASLASIYGHAARTDENTPAQMDGFHEGILLRSPVLANPTNQGHPILRGVEFQRRVLCNDIPSPSAADLAARAGTEAAVDYKVDSTAMATAKITSATSCMKCHSQINPVGFALEGYDNLGRARTVDTIFDAAGNFVAKHPVVINSTVSIGTSTKVVSSGTELVDQIAASQVGPACLARQMFRFYNIQKEAASDGCALAGTYTAMQDPGGSILAGIKASILNAYTTQRRIQ